MRHRIIGTGQRTHRQVTDPGRNAMSQAQHQPGRHQSRSARRGRLLLTYLFIALALVVFPLLGWPLYLDGSALAFVVLVTLAAYRYRRRAERAVDELQRPAGEHRPHNSEADE
jgi:Flp pilus assembly protein TadB